MVHAQMWCHLHPYDKYALSWAYSHKAHRYSTELCAHLFTEVQPNRKINRRKHSSPFACCCATQWRSNANAVFLTAPYFHCTALLYADIPTVTMNAVPVRHVQVTCRLLWNVMRFWLFTHVTAAGDVVCTTCAWQSCGSGLNCGVRVVSDKHAAASYLATVTGAEGR
jgi:hypothetical protein